MDILKDSTSRPWYVDESQDRKYTKKVRHKGLLVCQVNPNVSANAELIVRAVNSHEALVEALEKAQSTINALSTIIVESGATDDLMAQLMPELKTRNGQPVDAFAKRSRRTVNEAKAVSGTALAALSLAKGEQP